MHDQHAVLRPCVPTTERIRGPKPRLILAKATSIVDSLAIQACKCELALGQNAKDIALIYRYGTGAKATRLRDLTNRWARQVRDEKLYWVSQNSQAKSNYGINQAGVRLITTQSALGLEFKSVYLLWLEDFDRVFQDGNAEQQLMDLRELYVAMTRAQDQLTLICSSTSRLGAHLAREREDLGLEVIHA